MSVDTAREHPRPETIIRATAPVALLRDGEDTDNRPILSGYFSRFNEWTEIDSWFEGHFMERIAPGAYRKTFRDQSTEIRAMFQHGADPQVGDKPIGEPILLEERDEGAYHETRLFEGLPQLILDGLRAGQYGQSFRMQIMREEFQDEPDPSDDNPKALPERTIKEIRLFEFGPVTFPAYPNTTPEVRSLTDRFVFDWIQQDPARARELVGAADLHRAALGAADPAPSTTDAAPSGTSAPERRDRHTSGRYGLTQNEQRPSWAL